MEKKKYLVKSANVNMLHSVRFNTYNVDPLQTRICEVGAALAQLLKCGNHGNQ
jgi:hypothetical protein